MRLLHTLWLALLMPALTLAQSGPGGVGSSTTNFLWLDANYHVWVTSGAVGEWSDRSGNANHAVQSTHAQRPVLTGSVHNGYPGLLFDNDQTNYDFLRVPDNSTLEGMTGLTGFVVYQLLPGTAASAPRCFFSKRDGVDIQEAYDWFLWGGSSGSSFNQQLDIVNTNNRISSSTSYTTGTTYLNSFTYHGASPSNTSDQILYDGNTAVGNGTESATSIPNYTSDLYVGILRGHTGTGANVSRFNGYISEIILYNETLNDVQRIIVNNYLAAKYGTTMAASDLYSMDNPANGNYDHDVAGIGRSGGEVVDASRGSGIISMARSSGSISNNTYLFWGHDNGTMGAWGTSDMHGSLQGRLGRLWRVSEVNTSGAAADVGNVHITFDLNGLGPVTAGDLRLVVDINEDGTMANDTPISGATDLGGGLFRFSNVSAIANGRRFSIGTVNAARTPLPVTLLSFTGRELDDRRVQLDWSTASELGSDYFSVERSADLEDWHEVVRLGAAGNSQALMHYVGYDASPRASVEYYRLRQVDSDGQETYSSTISITARSTLEPLIWPNPATDRVELMLPGGTVERVELVDQQGRVVQELRIQPADRLSLPVRGIARGHYHLRLWTGQGPIVRSLVVAGEER